MNPEPVETSPAGVCAFMTTVAGPTLAAMSAGVSLAASAVRGRRKKSGAIAPKARNGEFMQHLRRDELLINAILEARFESRQ
jgi:hypothetical protein